MPDSSNKIDKSKKLQRYSFSTEFLPTKAIVLGNGIIAPTVN
ncbi:hypothetical protein [Okeania sp. SIO2C2]|nr:hypothetical protein [Okeania sp. SIO2C2]